MTKETFRSASRGVAPLVGAIFLFGFVIIGMSIYQAQVVPQQNFETEFEHNQEVLSELEETRDIIHHNGIEGFSQGKSITLGAYYTQRNFAINPPAPAGTLSTIEPTKNITIDSPNLEKNVTESTKFIRYEPQYREYTNAPKTTIEHTLLYNQFEQTNTPLIVSPQKIFQPDQFVIPIVKGDVSETSIDSVSLQTISVDTEKYDELEEVNITLPTEVPELWIEAIDEQDSDQFEVITSTDDSVTVTVRSDEVVVYQVVIDETPNNQLLPSIIDSIFPIDGSVPDGPVTIDPSGNETATEHETVNDEDFSSDQLFIPEGTDFVPEGDGDDTKGDDVDYTFESFQIDGNVSTREAIDMTATDGAINIGSTGSAISGNQLTLTATGTNGSINVDGATITTTIEGGSPGDGGGQIGIQMNTSGDLSAIGTFMETAAELELRAGGSIDLSDATLIQTSNDDILIRSEEGDIDLSGASIETERDITVIAKEGDIDLGDANLTAERDISITANEGDIRGSDTTITAEGDISTEADNGDIDLQSATLTADDDISIDAENGDIDLRGANLDAGDIINIQAQNPDGEINVSDAILEAGGQGSEDINIDPTENLIEANTTYIVNNNEESAYDDI